MTVEKPPQKVELSDDQIARLEKQMLMAASLIAGTIAGLAMIWGASVNNGWVTLAGFWAQALCVVCISAEVGDGASRRLLSPLYSRMNDDYRWYSDLSEGSNR